MTLRFSVLAIGSTGNAFYVETEDQSFLVDAGLSGKQMEGLFASIDREIKNLTGILVTHEHSDHITGLRPILNKLKVPIIASEKTLESLIKYDKLPKDAKVIPIYEDGIEITGIEIRRFSTSHDCVGSSGYTFILPDSKKFSLCTDLGIVTDEVRQALDGSDVVLMESNHDIEMLKKGPYSPDLKMRIMSDRGHISNPVCATEVVRLLEGGTKRFILGHLSQNNNTPLIARSCTESALIDIGAVNGKDYLLSVAKPTGNGVAVI